MKLSCWITLMNGDPDALMICNRNVLTSACMGMRDPYLVRR